MRKVLINVEDRELRVAILEDDQLSELYVESLDNRTILNNIYRGRIEGIVPGLKAAFVNIGLERNAFLHFDDVRPDLRYAPEGAEPVPGAEYIEQVIMPDEDLDDDDERPVAAAPESRRPTFHRDDDQDARRRRRGRRGGKRRRRDQRDAGDVAAPEPSVARHADERPQVPQPRRPDDEYDEGDNRGGRKRRRRRRRRGGGREGAAVSAEPGNRRDEGQPRQSRDDDQIGQAWVPPSERPAIGTRAATNPFDVFSPYAVQKGRRRQQTARPAGPGHRESQADFFNTKSRVPGAYYPPDHGEGDNLESDEYDGPAPGNELNPEQVRRKPKGGGGRGRRRTVRRRGNSYYAVRRKASKEGDSTEVEKKKPARTTAGKSGTPKSAPAKGTAKKSAAKSTAPKADGPAKKPARSRAGKPEAADVAPKARTRRSKVVAEEVAEAKPKATKRRTALEPKPETATVEPTPAAMVVAEGQEVPPARPTSRRGGAKKATLQGEHAEAATTAAEVIRRITEADLDVPVHVPESGTAADDAREQGRTPAVAPRPITVHDLPAPAPPQPRRIRRQLLPITDALKKGDEIMVQVIKEEIGLKGARITSHVSIPGRYLVLLPEADEEGGVSRKVSDFQERKRLKRLLRDIRHELGAGDVGFIVRTAGVDRDEREIRSDVEFLLNEWKRVTEKYETAKPGEAVYDDGDILYRLARDVFDEDISEILIDSQADGDKLRSILQNLIPSLVDKVKVYDEPENIFHRHQVERQIQKAGRRKVWLKSGGYLIIDEAEALTAIDVNTGKAVGKDDQEKLILKTNTEAARAIARELKLRDIGGIIVVDFIDMKDSKNRDQLLNEFRAVLRKDRSKTSVSGISEFGLVEMTRKRVRQSLRKTLFMDCPYCQGAGVVLNESQIWLHIKHEVVTMLEGKRPPKRLEIFVNSKLRSYIEQHYRDVFARWHEKYGVDVELIGSDHLHLENYAIDRKGGDGDRAVVEAAEVVVDQPSA